MGLNSNAAGRLAVSLSNSGVAAAGHEGSASEDAKAVENFVAGESLTVLRTKPPLAVVAVSATAAFPTLLVTDAFCLGLPKQVRRFVAPGALGLLGHLKNILLCGKI